MTQPQSVEKIGIKAEREFKDVFILLRDKIISHFLRDASAVQNSVHWLCPQAR